MGFPQMVYIILIDIWGERFCAHIYIYIYMGRVLVIIQASGSCKVYFCFTPPLPSKASDSNCSLREGNTRPASVLLMLVLLLFLAGHRSG